MSFTTAGPVASSIPTVDTTNAKNINSSDAILTGNINPNGANTTYWFEYSTDSLLGNIIGSGTPIKTLTGTGNQVVQIDVNGLQANTKYYYRLIGRNQDGTTNGNIVSFTTKRN